jgi:hypothetical protein
MPKKGANTKWAASMKKTARWPAPAASNLGSRLFFKRFLDVHVGLGWEHADLDRTGAISPFIWWHDGVCGGLEEIWSVNQWLGGVQVKPFFRFWVALKREQAWLLQQLGGV